MSTTVYTLTVQADSEVTLSRTWEDLSTTREPADGEVEFTVIPSGPETGPYHLSADGYEDLVVEVDDHMTVALEEQDDRDVITLGGQGSEVHYKFVVDGEVEKSEQYGATVNDYDTIDGSTVTGRTTNEPDSYVYTGEVVSFEADGGIGVAINGDEVDPSTLGEDGAGDGELGDYESVGADLDELEDRIEALEESSGGGDGSGDDEFPGELNDLRTRLEALEADVASLGGGVGGDGRSDEEIRQLMREYADSHLKDDIVAEVVGRVGSGGGEVDPDQLRAIVREELPDIVREELADIREKMEHHDKAFEFPARREGPPEPMGSYHEVPMWGIKFETWGGCYIHGATVDAKEAGTFTAVLGETDGIDKFEQVDSVEVEVDEGVQHIDLDLEVPEAGYYLLAREGDHPLRRGAWNGWKEHAVDNLRLVAGDKPGHSENDYWYYFFNLEMTASKDHELPK